MASALAIGLALPTGAAGAERLLSARCELGAPLRLVKSLKALPAAVRGALIARTGPMADAGEFFNASDVVERPAPFKRLVLAGRKGTRWFVWYEQGGRAYWIGVAVLDTDAPASPRLLFDGRGGDDAARCETTRKLLDAPRGEPRN